MDALVPKLQELNTKRVEVGLKREKDAGAAYLTKAAAEAGAVKTASGMVFKTVKEGTGASPTASDTVTVHYEGRFLDGKVFDSSIKRKEPATSRWAGVIPCWTEGVQQMKVGGKAQLVCPAELAYGDQGQPPRMRGGARWCSTWSCWTSRSRAPSRRSAPAGAADPGPRIGSAPESRPPARRTWRAASAGAVEEDTEVWVTERFRPLFGADRLEVWKALVLVFISTRFKYFPNPSLIRSLRVFLTGPAGCRRTATWNVILAEQQPQGLDRNGNTI